jgi:hypothetical protein
MWPFVIRLLWFSVITAVIVVLLLLATSFKVRNEKYYQLPSDKRHIILGHSHAANAYNDSLLPGFANMADATEGYFYTFVKARKLLEANPQIKTVFIEFTNNQFSEYANERNYGQYARHLIPKYLSNMSLKEAGSLVFRIPSTVVMSIPQAIAENFSFLFAGESSFIKHKSWGGYIAYTKTIKQKDIDSSAAAATSANAVIRHSYGISEASLWSLGKMVKYCHSKNVAVVFLRSPTLKMPGQSFPECVLMDILRFEFSNVKFLDFQDFPVKNSDFADSSTSIRQGQKSCRVSSPIFCATRH